MATILDNPDVEITHKTDERVNLDKGYKVICWNDPVNLMPYVTKVFQTVFGWDKTKAEKHMKEVHEQGKSLLVRENFELAEHYCHKLQSFGLTATIEKE